MFIVPVCALHHMQDVWSIHILQWQDTEMKQLPSNSTSLACEHEVRANDGCRLLMITSLLIPQLCLTHHATIVLPMRLSSGSLLRCA